MSQSKYENKLLLPSINYTPGHAEIDRKEKINLKNSVIKYNILKSLELYNSGNKIAILASCVDGQGEWNISDLSLFNRVGRDINQTVKSMSLESELITSATSYDLKNVIQDDKISSIFVIGHANYHTWCASDKSVNWNDLGECTTHLKNGLFVNIGCGAINSWNMVPLGYFVVDDHKNLYGYEAEYAYSESLHKLTNLDRLKRIPSLESLTKKFI